MTVNKVFCSIAAVGAVSLVLTACGGEDDASSGESVTVQLDYQVRGNHAMFYVADEKGYFEDEGIDVESITTGSGSPDTLRLVGKGQADFGFADLPSLATARSQGVPVTALAAVNQQTPLSMCAKEEEHTLDSPEDLKGLTVGIHPAGSTFYFYKALLAANGIDRSELEEVTVTPPYENYLLQDRVDTVICYIDAEVPELEDKAGGEGSLSILSGAQNGYDVYGSGLFTNQQLVEDDPELVQHFVNAYLRAFEYVIDHPEEAAEIVAESSPELATKTETFERQLEADIESTFTSDYTDKHGIGSMSDEEWRSTVDTLVEQGVIEGEPPAVDTMRDTTFVDKYHK